MVTQIIFDTNAYRELVYGKDIRETISIIRDIKKREATHNISAFASPIVWTELFCHLSDPQDKALDNCYCALIGSYIHCMQNEETNNYKIIADGDDLLAQLLFDYVDPNAENLYHGFARLIKEIYNNKDWKDNKECISNLISIKAASDKEETNFLGRFREIASSYSTRKEGRKKMLSVLRSKELFHLIAETQVLKALNFVKEQPVELTYAELNKKAELVKSYFPATLYLSIYIMDKLICAPGFDINKNKRHNWVWDYQLLFSISKLNANILITDDSAMLDAAKAANLSDKVMKLESYKGLLGI